MSHANDESLNEDEQGFRTLLLNRKEIYALFLFALCIPMVSFSLGIYIGKEQNEQQVNVATSTQISSPTKNDERSDLKSAGVNVSTTTNESEIEEDYSNEFSANTSEPPFDRSETKPEENSSAESIADVKHNLQEENEFSATRRYSTNKDVLEGQINNESKLNLEREFVNIGERRSRAPERSSSALEFKNQSLYIVQVGLFKESLSAQKRRAELNQQFDYWILPKVSLEHGTRYSIILGFYKNKVEARKAAEQYKVITQDDAYVSPLSDQQVEMALANL